MKNFLEIKDLHAEVGGKEILRGVNLSLECGKVNVLMGPNGSGKSTLAHILMGHPGYKVISGKIFFNGKDITDLDAEERAKKGVFLSFQNPISVSGVSMHNLLKTALKSLKNNISINEKKKIIDEKSKILGIEKNFLERYLNDGFSGGEKKKAEILQLMVLNPKLAVLDETDSGLDIDALKTVSRGVNTFINEQKCVLLITHYKRILNYIRPDKIFILINGKIAIEGGPDLAGHLEEKGYGWIVEEAEVK
ncbi:Fe-S cluster assembly ATPase SufC [Candidatus Pacearchaeota archaeon]|nr:Fe-S cluster assembly ATPase SufC [Candidatus Pacearchaeota archaeon]